MDIRELRLLSIKRFGKKKRRVFIELVSYYYTFCVFFRHKQWPEVRLMSLQYAKGKGDSEIAIQEENPLRNCNLTHQKAPQQSCKQSSCVLLVACAVPSLHFFVKPEHIL